MSDFERIIDAEEKYANGDISFEEYSKIIDVNSNLKSSSSEKSNIDEIKKLRDRISTTIDNSGIKDVASSFANRVNRDSVNSAVRKASNIGRNILSSGKSLLDDTSKRVKNSSTYSSISSSIASKSIGFKSETCIHPLYYLESEIAPSYFESELFKRMSDNLCVCKCLNCGQELSFLKSEVSNKLVIDSLTKRCQKRYEKAKLYYLQYKDTYGTDEIKNIIESELNDEFELKL